jgi:hypothetical protein
VIQSAICLFFDQLQSQLGWGIFKADQKTTKWLIGSLSVGRGPISFWPDLSTQIFSDFSRFYSSRYSQNEKTPA